MKSCIGCDRAIEYPQSAFIETRELYSPPLHDAYNGNFLPIRQWHVECLPIEYPRSNRHSEKCPICGDAFTGTDLVITLWKGDAPKDASRILESRVLQFMAHASHFDDRRPEQ